MGSRILKEPEALCVQEPISFHGGAVLLRSPDFRVRWHPQSLAGGEHSFGNAVRGSHGVTSPTFPFMGSEYLHEINANRDLEPLMGGATLCGALIKP